MREKRVVVQNTLNALHKLFGNFHEQVTKIINYIQKLLKDPKIAWLGTA